MEEVEMPIGVIRDIPGGHAQLYEAVNRRVGLADDPPAGLLVHGAGPSQDGWRVIELWESAERFGHFMEQRLDPAVREASAEAGFRPSAPPTISTFEVQNIYQRQP